MENIEELNESYIALPQGFKASGCCADLKGNGALDVALVASDIPSTVAGVYTTNLVKGHSLQRSIKLLNSGKTFRAIVVNAKNANACVGQQGEDDANAIAAMIAKKLNCQPEEVLTASTGIIGIRMPVDNVLNVAPSLVSSLSNSPEASHNAMSAMMTTDTIPKEVSAKVTLKGGNAVTISGMAKGSGMIHPNLATMIGIFTTDAMIDRELLSSMLKKAVSHTFNRVSVDGDTSVCVSVMIFANGASGIKIEEGSDDAILFEEALSNLSNDIARMIASDGEGATKLIEIVVHGAKTEKDAKLVVTSVARSPLVKTAIFGMDANWGRVLTAVGYSGADFDPNKVSIKLCGVKVCENGNAAEYNEEDVKELLHEHDISIDIDLKDGEFDDRMYTCDFSYDYVKINGSYRS